MRTITTQYLVVGAGACGLAFADELVRQRPDAEVVLVDRRPSPGGHWLDAYPFVRLHVPSAYYGVGSTRLGHDRVDVDGPNAGMYELATGAEVVDYFRTVLDDVLLPTGRVRFLGGHEHLERDGRHRLVDLSTGSEVAVEVRRAVVDAAYSAGEVPATHVPSYAVAQAARVVPPGALPSLPPAPAYLVLGSGKTGIDACLWLLDQGVDAGRVTWVRPRDPWLVDRATWQPLDQVASVLEGMALELEALAGAADLDDLFRRLEQRGRLLRLDDAVEPTAYRCATVSRRELAALRSITDVVRLGHVVRVGTDAVELTGGSVPTAPGTVVVDCTARGIRKRPPRPVFEPGRITLQPVRTCVPVFNAALVAWVEARRDDDAEKNRLCPPNPYPDTAADWVRCFVAAMACARTWSAEPDLSAWLETTRLNLLRGVPDHLDDPRMPAALERFAANVKPGTASARRLLDALATVPGQPSPPTVAPAAPA